MVPRLPGGLRRTASPQRVGNSLRDYWNAKARRVAVNNRLQMEPCGETALHHQRAAFPGTGQARRSCGIVKRQQPRDHRRRWRLYLDSFLSLQPRDAPNFAAPRYPIDGLLDD